MPFSTAYESNVKSMLGSIKTVPIPEHAHPVHRTVTLPFITLSRAPGAGGSDLATQLAAELNKDQPQDQLWTCWDRQLVERIATDLHVSDRLIEHFEERNRSWLTDFLDGISMSEENSDDIRLFRRVATTLRALAMAGRTVLVGRGGALLTHTLPGGIHIRLVAPFEYRANQLMAQRSISHAQAVAELRTLDHNRRSFYRRFWNRDDVHDDDFSAVYNTSLLEDEQIVRSIIALLRPAGSGHPG